MATVLAKPTAAAAPRASLRAPFERRKSRAFKVGLGLSAALHVLLFATVTFHYRIEPAAPRAPLRAYHVEPVMQAYEIEAITVAPGMPEPEPLPARPVLVTPVPDAPRFDAPAPSSGEAPVTAPARPRSAPERLRQGYTDPQLLRPANRLPPPEVTEGEWLRLRLAERLEVYNDSIAAEAAAKLAATDWTVKGKDGERWGVTPGQIHLGKVTLPLPFGFSASPDRRAEAAARARSWNESQAQGARVEAAETFEQRVKAIRQRQQAARDSARKAGGG